ncbi:helix-turn-helix domain-containing protein [Dolosicoccus paucivorans]|uniref:helix-turn-helix domain-containing protein n=1 Tax=Dolosicoccus paucivorans TaxID=84521 RepID=UPI0008883EFE|nr:helix-turn-helix transcriptional regulator [Dolosicoccus paucivorans]SDI37063.1 transcriptional regulator, XRE family [Dolosicoccus paucivorans]
MRLQRLRALRQEHSLKQVDVAEILKCRQPTYSDYERGKLSLSPEGLAILAKYYHVSVDYILGLTDVKNPYPPSRHLLNH